MPAKKIVKKVVQKQEKQKMVDFGTAIARFWTNYVNFSGCSQRSEFWFFILFNALVTMPFSIMGLANPVLEAVFMVPWYIATVIPFLALYSRRFHDAGFSAKWLWLPLVLIFGFGVLGAASAAADDNFVMMVFVGISVLLTLGGFAIFWLVVCLLPSRLKNNPYRK